MARDHEPMTDDELDAFHDAMEKQGEERREALAEDLGGEPADYDAEASLNDHAGEPVADGSE